jgi:hypothetical protein
LMWNAERREHQCAISAALPVLAFEYNTQVFVHNQANNTDIPICGQSL